MVSDETHVLSLTGRGSHTVRVPAGQGRLSIGPVVPGWSRPDVVVGPDDVLDWSAFDEFRAPAGYPWPRGFTYRGSDIGFLAWSRRRPIESFSWTPTSPMTVDAGPADIREFTVDLRQAALSIMLPRTTRIFTASGDLGLLRATWPATQECPLLFLYPRTRPAGGSAPLRLPPFVSFDAVRSVFVKVTPLRQALDCTSLLQFPHLTELRLFGRLAHLDALARFVGLKRIQLGDCPHLDGFPPLTTWPDLNDFHAADIARDAGQRLRRQLKDHPVPRASVTGLRTAEWFEREYGLPFSSWAPTTARRAVRAFRTAEAAEDPEAGIRAFVRTINTLPGIDTIERDDAGDAVAMLAARANIDESLAQTWFDEERDF